MSIDNSESASSTAGPAPGASAPSVLGGQDLEYVAVRIAKIEATSAAAMVDFHIIQRAGAAAIGDTLGTNALEDFVEFLLADLEGVVMMLELIGMVEVQGQLVVDADNREMRELALVAQPQYPRGELRRGFLVMCRNDGVIELDRHRCLHPTRCVCGKCLIHYQASGLERARAAMRWRR